ncbi:MAG: hypothetical protein HP477_09780 [Nitrospira sp.]|nr:hypothetical protein [Nitrospira sp.]
MPSLWNLPVIILMLSFGLGVPAYAQLGAGQQDATKILNGMPPDVLAKVQALAQMLQQGIKDGKLTDAEVKQGLMSGRLAEKLKQLNPEADQLLNDISTATKDGTGPGEESLMPLLGGLGISPN